MLNEVTLVGHVEYNVHLVEGVNRFKFCVPRKSGAKDRFIVSVYMESECDLIAFEKIKIIGYMESKSANGKLYVNVAATTIIFETEDDEGTNEVYLSGELCSDPAIRYTPLGKTILDVIVRIRNSATENYYVPVILWGDDANKAADMKAHDIISIKGRFQSRDYNKRISDTETRVMTAYEVSARLI